MTLVSTDWLNTNLNKAGQGMEKYSNKTNLGRAFKNALNKKTKKNNKMKRTKKRPNPKPSIYETTPPNLNPKPKSNVQVNNYSQLSGINLTSTSSNA